MVEGSKWNHQLAIWLLRLSLELNIFSLRQGPVMWHTWFLLHSLVHVAKFIGKICLLSKTLAGRKTSDSAAFKTNGPFCPEDEIEIWGPSRSRGSEKSLYRAAFHAIQIQNLTWSLQFCLKSWKEWLIRPAWDVEKQASKRRSHGSQKDMEEKILFTVKSVWTLQTFL